MAKKPKTNDEAESAYLARLDVAYVDFAIVGQSPLVMHRQSQKDQRHLTLPPKKKNKTEREAEAKHDPVGEFRGAIYRNRLDDTPTVTHMPAGAFKRAMAEAALRIPGGNKTETGQLVHVVNETVFIYGVPFMFAQWVREGMSKTPNVRFLPIFPEWCCMLRVMFIPPLTNDEIVFNLLVGAGNIMGIGDGRPQKGKFARGRFMPVAQDDATYQRIMKTGGRAAQIAAINAAEPYDEDCRELVDWFYGEAKNAALQIHRTGIDMDSGMKNTPMNFTNEQKIAALDALADANGDVDADRLWQAAQNPGHPLHGLKEWCWDEREAAIEHWRYVARRIIASCYLERSFHEVEFRVPKYVRNPEKLHDEQGYATVFRLASDDELARRALEAEINRIESAIGRALSIAQAFDLSAEFERMLKHATRIRQRVRPEPVDA